MSTTDDLNAENLYAENLIADNPVTEILVAENRVVRVAKTPATGAHRGRQK